MPQTPGRDAASDCFARFESDYPASLGVARSVHGFRDPGCRDAAVRDCPGTDGSTSGPAEWSEN